MGRSLFLGTVLGAIIVFVWMMISWMVLPWHCAVVNTFENEQQVSRAVLENTAKDGVYVLPGMCDIESTEAHAAAVKKGPVIFTAVQRYGFDVDSATPYILSFIVQLISAFLVTYLLLQTKAPGYWRGVWFITVLGLTIGVVGSLPNWNWWGFSLGYVGVEIADLLVSWFLASFVISAVARRSWQP